MTRLKGQDQPQVQLKEQAHPIWAQPKERETSSPEVGLKYDKGKVRLDLLPYDALTSIAEVFTYGATKYADRNWELGISWSRCYAAMMRHMFAYWRGEDLDSETGLPHLAHAGCCLLFLLSYHLRNMNGYDDRSRQEVKPNG